MTLIQEIVWGEDTELHVWLRHKVGIEEIEEAAYNSKLVVRGRGKNVYEVCGQTDGGRYLLVVVRLISKNRARLITARDMTDTEKRRYQQNTAH